MVINIYGFFNPDQESIKASIRCPADGLFIISFTYSLEGRYTDQLL